MHTLATRVPRLSLAAMVAAIVAVAAACGGDDDGTPGGSNPQTASQPGASGSVQPTVSQPGTEGGDEHPVVPPPAGSALPSTPVGVPTPDSDAIVIATIGGREVLTTGGGFALYVFDNDPPNAGTSACFASCASAWPPLVITGTPQGPAEIAAALGTITRENESILQVTYQGRPLHRYANDEAGEVTGDGAGRGVWHVATPTP